jgi:hypothetical protein
MRFKIFLLMMTLLSPNAFATQGWECSTANGLKIGLFWTQEGPSRDSKFSLWIDHKRAKATFELAQHDTRILIARAPNYSQGRTLNLKFNDPMGVGAFTLWLEGQSQKTAMRCRNIMGDYPLVLWNNSGFYGEPATWEAAPSEGLPHGDQDSGSDGREWGGRISNRLNQYGGE